MGHILGLDLGTSSIGWAVINAEINNEGQVDRYISIEKSGVRIFPEGIESDTLGKGQGEKTKNSVRREYRQMRRQYFRRKWRKMKLLEILIEYKMCPLAKEELDEWKKWNSILKSESRRFPNSHRFINWLKLNPYDLRVKGLDQTLTLEEFGRVLYHMIQRRGFMSSRQDKEAGKIFEGNDEMAGIENTRHLITTHRTLGKALSQFLHKPGEPFRQLRDSENKLIRIRGRYTERKMYLNEFFELWNRQAAPLGLNNKIIRRKKTRYLSGSINQKRNQEMVAHLIAKYGEESCIIDGDRVTTYDDIKLGEYLAGRIELDDDGDIKFKGSENSLMFFQRPLRSQKHTLGHCRFEPSKTPCPDSHPEYEAFRMYQFINNIEFGTNHDPYRRVIGDDGTVKLTDLFDSKDKNFPFSLIPKKLGLVGETFNFEDETVCPANKTIASLRPLFEAAVWSKHMQDIWHCFYFYKDNDLLIAKLIRDYNLAPEKSEKVKIIKLSDKYASVSLKAIRNITPFLKKGYKYSTAVVLGGVRNAFGARWADFASDHPKIEKDILSIISQTNKTGEMIEKIKSYLMSGSGMLDFGFRHNDPGFRRLYHPSQDTNTDIELKTHIDQIEDLRNPLVQQALNETRRLVNRLINEYGSFDIVRIEMGRELKQNKDQRQRASFEINQNRKKNDDARSILTEFGLAHSRDNMRKYRLFKEIEERSNGPVVCPYTNKTISPSALLSDRNLFQIEHIVPYSVSLDDSYGNITLCESNFNRDKGERTPYEYYQMNPDPVIWGGAQSWEEIEMRAYHLLPYNKARRFSSRKPYTSEEFISRQLNDMRYISKKARDIMLEVCRNVQVLPGQLTADLRRLWGLNSALQPIESFNSEQVPADLEQFDTVPVWVVKDKDNKIVHSVPKYNRRPDTEASEMLVPGQVENERFIADRLTKEDVAAPGYPNGEYWQKTVFSSVSGYTPVYTERPAVDENHIVLKGVVDKKGSFQYENLQGGAQAGVPDGRYWAIFPVITVKASDGNDKPAKLAKGDVLLFGSVADKVFTSYIYSRAVGLPDGKYWLILSTDPSQGRYLPTTNAKPEIAAHQRIVFGRVGDDGWFTAEIDMDFSLKTTLSRGVYYLAINVDRIEPELIAMTNPAPVAGKNKKVIEGNLIIGTHSGELLFDPAKNREDQRHHAIDAIAIALTERAFYQKLSTYNAGKKQRERNQPGDKPVFAMPWPGFHLDARKAVGTVFISYKQNRSVLKKIVKTVIKDGKAIRSVGFGVRGQLHKESVFGKRTAPDQITAYHIRKSITALGNNKHVDKVVDEGIRQLIKDYLKTNYQFNINREYKIPKNAFFENGEYKLFLPNRNGDPVPVKKVRMRENLDNARQLKPWLNQYVNPRNNHHVMIWRDAAGNLQESVVSFWEAVERRRKGEPVYQMPKEGVEIVATMQINDMFLLGLPEEYVHHRERIAELSPEYLSHKLYRVQKLSASYYTFRYHLASSVKNGDEEISIHSMVAWSKIQPVKVRISTTGLPEII